MNTVRLAAGHATGTAPRSDLTAERIWHELEKASFAVIAYVTPAGKPRASGVACAAEGRRVYIVTAPDSWKARHIADGDEVAVTVPIRRGRLLSLVAPIPPATVSFHARTRVERAGSVSIASVSKKLAALLPRERRNGCLFELVPEGSFQTYGVGVSLRDMMHLAAAQARVPFA